ncbi:MAG: GtrA family protein [Oscillospiraceae bacterium]|jgi:putative flippase GtrA|nr:GtrA family protein [Oscillospiraceae bacterium]
MIQKYKPLFFQAIRFGMVGAINTLITNGLFNLLLKLSEPAAWVIGYAAGMVFSLFANTKFTFRQKERLTASQVARFILLNLVSLGASTLTVWLLTDTLAMTRLWAGIISTVVSVVINFVGSKLLVFNNPIEK